MDTSKPFSKQYLKLLIKQITLRDGVALVQGNRRALAGAIRCRSTKNPITAKTVIGFNGDWRPLQDSNLRPTA